MRDNQYGLTISSTLLDLLRADGTVLFFNDAKLCGDGENHHIHMYDDQQKHHGAHSLDEEGLALALTDQRLFCDAEQIGMIRVNADSELLDLLKNDVVIVFPNGASLRADTSDYIEMKGRCGEDLGIQAPNEDGLTLALMDEDLFAEPEVQYAQAM
jgi:hypothetical protein